MSVWICKVHHDVNLTVRYALDQVCAPSHLLPGHHLRMGDRLPGLLRGFVAVGDGVPGDLGEHAGWGESVSEGGPAALHLQLPGKARRVQPRHQQLPPFC